MNTILIESIEQVWLSLQHNWPFLVASVVVATLFKLYVDAEKVAASMSRNRGKSVIAATIASVATPLCSCGTTAVALGMIASTVPWAPIVAFIVASPLTSPEELIYSAGLFGWPFALAFYLASIVLGLAGGWAAAVLEGRGLLANQARFAATEPASCACPANDAVPVAPGRVFSLESPLIELSPAGATCGCTGTTFAAAERSSQVETNTPQAYRTTVTPMMFLNELYSTGRNLLVMFLGFAFIGYLLNGLIPDSWVSTLFGSGNIYNVPLAATLGLPFYINSEASLPLVRALMDGGMSQGAALAFLISGAGTSIGAISGALTIARWRIIALVVAVLWIGAILCGYAYNLASILKLFS